MLHVVARRSCATTATRALRWAAVGPTKNLITSLGDDASLFLGAFPVVDGRFKSTAVASAPSVQEQQQPSLTRVPSLPFVGSMFPPHSGVPPNVRDGYKFWPEMRRRFGDFYTMGIPIIGNPDDKHSTVYVVHDPVEMHKVVRGEGKYPLGLIQGFWPNLRYLSENGFVTVEGDDRGFMGNGEGWKRYRAFLQTDLLHPEAARGYVPGMVEAARHASRGAPASMDALNEYFNRCSFDLFSTIMFGEYTKTADLTGDTDPENAEFVEAATSGLSAAIAMINDPFEILYGKVLGFHSSKYGLVCKGYNTSWRISQSKIQRFLESKKEGKISDNQAASYLARAIDRREDDGCNITQRELEELAFAGLFAAVDTTSTTMSWCVMNLALNMDVQEELHRELKAKVEEFGDDNGDGTRRLNVRALDRSAVPYLHAVVRESHRRTPIGPISVSKRVVTEGGMYIHGVHVPKGSVVALCGYPLMMDESIVDSPESFRPERWFPDAVEARKGTPSEVIDHPFFKDAFSQGPRKCPASRVAANEILVMMAQLVLDWKISPPSDVSSLKDVKYERKTGLQPSLPALQFEARA